jgi:multidrug/hemolysin transport system permease protein
MSLFTLVLAEIYIVIEGGEIMSFVTLLKVLMLILLGDFVNTSIVFLLVTLFKSENAFSTASTIIGTVIGFLTGIYLPIGNLPTAMQWVVKLFPVSHATSLFRSVMMEESIKTGFAGIPAEYLTEFKEMMGVYYKFGDYKVSNTVSIIILVVTGIIFYLLAVLSMSRKTDK